ncbi:DMT family transporter [Caminibacter sp.]
MDRGILLMIFASLSFAIMGGAVKLLSRNIPAVEVTFFRNFIGVLIIGYALYKFRPQNIGGKPLLLFFRGFMGFLALLAYFYNMAHIPLGVAVTYNKTSPLFLAFFAWLFLKEKLPKSALLALILGFLGIVFIAKPDGFHLSKYDILGIFSGIGAALAYTSIRELRKYYDTRTIALSFMGIGTIGPVVLMLFASFVNDKDLDFLFADFVMPRGSEWFLILLIGLTATLSQYLMTKAYTLTKAGIVGTITYSQILFGTIIGVMLGDSLPDIYTIVGMVLIVSAGLLVIVKKN